MNTFQIFKSVRLVNCLLVASLVAILESTNAAETTNEFSKPVIDIGIVVSDAGQSARFLTEAIGFKEVQGFSVTAELGKKIGLIEGHPVDVRVFLLNDENRATRIKILSFPKASSKQPDQATIHSTLGMRYLTLYVNDINKALARLKKEKIPLLGESPVDLGGGTMLVAVKDPDGNFIELIGPAKK